MRKTGIIIGLMAALVAVSAKAQNSAAPLFPSLVDVVDVAADDVLNIRAEPNASSEIVGAFAHDASGVEVLAHSEDGGWAKVGVPEGNGWISRRFLADSALAPRVTCLGTEPFWRLDDASEELLMPEARVALQTQYEVQSSAPGEVLGARVYAAPDYWLYLRYLPAACNDGMSDREYGLVADLDWLVPDRGMFAVSGCCTIGHTGPLEEH